MKSNFDGAQVDKASMLNTEWSSDIVQLFNQVFRPLDYTVATVCGSNLDDVINVEKE